MRAPALLAAALGALLAGCGPRTAVALTDFACPVDAPGPLACHVGYGGAYFQLVTTDAWGVPVAATPSADGGLCLRMHLQCTQQLVALQQTLGAAGVPGFTPTLPACTVGAHQWVYLHLNSTTCQARRAWLAALAAGPPPTTDKNASLTYEINYVVGDAMLSMEYCDFSLCNAPASSGAVGGRPYAAHLALAAPLLAAALALAAA